MSKDLKRKERIGRGSGGVKKKIIGWVVAILLIAGGVYAAFQYAGETTVEVAVAEVRRGEFTDAVPLRGEIRSSNSIELEAPRVPNLTITSLLPSGTRVSKGDVVVEFDAATQEQTRLQYQTNVEAMESEVIQMQASHTITDESDAMNLMTAEYNLERARLEASKAEVISRIEGAKNRINVDLSEGELGQVQTSVNAHEVAQAADLQRLNQRKDKATRDLERVEGYMSNMVIRAPIDGYVNILSNFRASGSFGSRPPAFKEGDSVWTGASIAEIPDLSEMVLDCAIAEVDRGRVKINMPVRIQVDAVPDRQFAATLSWISPIASESGTTKYFPAEVKFTELDDRLRPGMSASAQIIIERLPDVLLIPTRASITYEGLPAVRVQNGDDFEIRTIEVGQRNSTNTVVLSGLEEGETVALEDPAEAARRATESQSAGPEM